MKMNTITSVWKQLFFLSLFLGVSLWSFLVAFSRVQTNVVKTPYGVLEQNGVSIVYHKGDVQNSFLKVSPFDDYVYLKDGKKEHVFDVKEKETVKTEFSLWEKTRFHFFTFLRQTDSLSWHVTSKQREIVYTATLSEKELHLQRDIVKDTKEVAGYGNALVLCHTCFVTDTTRMFFSGVYTTNDKLALAAKIQLTPILVSETLPETTSLKIRKGEKTLFEIESRGEVLYQEPWRLLEIKSNSPIQKVRLAL